MKQKKKMLILVGMLVILAALYGGLRVWNQKSEEKEAKRAEADRIHITETDGLSEFSYTNGTDKMGFVWEDGTWYYDEDKEIPVSQSTVEGIANAVEGLTAARELKNPDALEDYGLTEPSYTIQYTSDDGTESELYIGDATGEDYYATVGNTGKVYTITSSLVSQLQFELSGVVENDSVPSIGSGNLKKVEITENGETTTYKDEDELAELAGGFGVLSLTDCVDYHVSAENLTGYGLDEASRMTAAATYKDSGTEENETFTVYIGKMDESGTYRYLMVKDSKMVYQVSKDVAENMTVTETEAEE